MKNLKLLTSTEKTIAIIEEYIAFTKRIEAKYEVRVKYNVDTVKDMRKKGKK